MEREGEESYRVSMRDAVILYDILVTGIELPPAIVAAINRKIEQYYIAEEYKFRVEREKRESERKSIEAEGIRDFQQIVSQGISESYLRWRGVEATLQLSQSTNSKVVVIGSGRDGLPVILGGANLPAPRPRGACGAGVRVARKEQRPRARRCRWRKRRLQDWRRRPKRYRLLAQVLRLPPATRARAHFGRSTCRISRHTSLGL